jgi:outer membrane receptor for ferrienterochelin and colicin
MKRIHLLAALCVVLFPMLLNAQQFAEISGQVSDKSNLRPLSKVKVQIDGQAYSARTDSGGRYRIEGVQPGSYNIRYTLDSYTEVVRYNVVLTSGNINVINVEMEPEVQSVGTVSIRTTRKTARAATLETPLSVQRLTIEEIKSNPGGNFDISRVIQSLPGVGGTAGSVGGFRNDIIIRGGAPNENVYYLDGIEIPQINHFATQGSAGGPSGILNVSFIEDVKLSSSAFDAGFDNTLSSVLDFKQKKGNTKRLQGNVRMSATEFATTLDGPIGKSQNTTFLASARRSYLQFLFQAIDLPIRPNYWDFQYTINHRINQKSSITFLGVGAIDEFSFAVPSESTPEKTYVLNSNPNINQWNYTTGVAYKRSLKRGNMQIALSRNMLDNSLRRYEDNLNPTPQNQSFDVQSQESENKLRIQVSENIGQWKLSYGAVLQYIRFDNRGFARIRAAIRDTLGNLVQPEIRAQLNSNTTFFRQGAHFQAGRRFFDNRLGASFGVRIDGNSFTEGGMRMWEQFSPRLSLSYVLAPRFNLNGSVGRYFKLPPYTMLGFRDRSGNLLNRDSRYIRSDHYVLGLEYLPNPTRRFTLEGFYKVYNNVPVSVRDGISLSNRGGDFNILGNEDVVSNGSGRTYGMEFFAQQKLTKKFFGILSYTLCFSEYTGADGVFRPSAWDSRHLLSLTWGYKFPRNWELGLKFRYQGGAPFTPFDETASRLNYLSTGEGILDLNRLNTQRLNSFHASDVRIDKKWNLKRVTIDIFLDVSNWYIAPTPAYPQYTFQRTPDNSGFATTNGGAPATDGSNAIPLILSNNDATVLPTFGFIVEF